MKMTLSSSRLLGLTFACLFPSLLTLFYFVLLKDSSPGLQQVVYGAGKFLQFTFPLWFTLWILKSKIRLPLKFSKEIGVGLLFGLAIGFLIIFLPQASFFPEETRQLLITNVQQKVSGLGLNSLGSFVMLGVFYSLIHSFLEEYYWRWFVYGQMSKLTSPKISNILSSLGFMAHHILVLGVFFGWHNPFTYFFSLAVGLGGMFWAWHYERTGSLLGPWLSHLLVDAAIFYVGYQLLQFPM